jgi:hypothetical protein
MVLTTT